MFQSFPVSPPRELSLAVVGLAFPNPDKSSRRFEAALCVPGEPVFLVLEPSNRADSRAVAVYSARQIQLGYLTAERCGWVGGRLRAGEPYEAIFQDLAGSAALIRARFGGGAPALPAPRASIAWADDPIDSDPPGSLWGA